MLKGLRGILLEVLGFPKDTSKRPLVKAVFLLNFFLVLTKAIRKKQKPEVTKLPVAFWKPLCKYFLKTSKQQTLWKRWTFSFQALKPRTWHGQHAVSSSPQVRRAYLITNATWGLDALGGLAWDLLGFNMV